MEEETVPKNNVEEKVRIPSNGTSYGSMGPPPPSEKHQRTSSLEQFHPPSQSYPKPHHGPSAHAGPYTHQQQPAAAFSLHQRSGSSGYPSFAPPPPHHSFYQQGFHSRHQLSHNYPPHPYGPRSAVPLVRSVVTHSFSMEEEQREDGSSRYIRSQAFYTPREEYRSPGGCTGRDEAADPKLNRNCDHEADADGFFFETPIGLFDCRPSADGENVGPLPPTYCRDLPSVPEEGGHSRLPPPPEPQNGVMMRRGSGVSVPIPPSPNGPPIVQRSHSTGSYRSIGGTPLKRSFWHHSRPAGAGGEEFESTLPQEFMPPKRSKVTPPSSSSRRSKDYVVTARTARSDRFCGKNHDRAVAGNNAKNSTSSGSSHSSTGNNSVVMGSPMMQSPTESSNGWGYGGRVMSWETREDCYRRDPRSAPSWSSRSPGGRDAPSTGSHWSEPPYMPSPRSRYDAGFNNDIHTWGSRGGSWGVHPQDYSWPSSVREGHDGKHLREEREGVDDGPSIEIGHGSAFDDGGMHFTIRPPPERDSDRTLRREGGQNDIRLPESVRHEDMYGIDKKDGPIRLLALSEDRISLSETLCIVRENIEVFTASLEDVEAPAPGRKHAVSVGQVGLRCIHCRHCTRSSERVKRAVCYPSSIKRIYRTVIDMKLDHFLHCKFVPQSLKDTLTALKANNTRSTGTTMQYFIRAAEQLGMVDAATGVRLAEGAILSSSATFSSPLIPSHSPKLLTPPTSERKSVTVKGLIETQNSGDKSDWTPNSEFRIHRNSSMSSEGTAINSLLMDDVTMPKEIYTGHISLALTEDKMSLSPLRCFLRQQVCAFTATEQDIAVRTPTTFSVSVGQVGIGCIHCMHQPAKMRLNRAACFPFSIGRIYQAVADIQRFHLSECKDVPKDIKEKFLQLQSQSSKGSKGLATRQYWVTAAKKVGLADTPKGIRFIRDPAVPEQKPVSLDILAQVASHVTTVNRPLVLPEDKPFIAEFLYAVMEQLQPCRFTEADRNKRRIKDVGCIGVECKHCAGQVDSRKFFWSSVNAVESNFVSVHTHMMECKMVSPELKDNLASLKKLRKEQTAALKTGSQKKFFGRVWKRLHEGEESQEKRDHEKDIIVAGFNVSPSKTRIKPESRDVAESMEMSLSQIPMELTPTSTPQTSPCTAEKRLAEIKLETSHGSPPSTRLDNVSLQLEDVTMTESV